MRCLSTGPGRFWLEEQPEVSWPARGFGPRWNSWDSPQVDRSTLVALLAHLLIVGHGVTAFNLDAAGVVSVLDESDRVRRQGVGKVRGAVRVRHFSWSAAV